MQDYLKAYSAAEGSMELALKKIKDVHLIELIESILNICEFLYECIRKIAKS